LSSDGGARQAGDKIGGAV